METHLERLYKSKLQNALKKNVMKVALLSSPSSSMREDLPAEFDKAETSGSKGDCTKYEKQCNVNVLNVFSKIL